MKKADQKQKYLEGRSQARASERGGDETKSQDKKKSHLNLPSQPDRERERQRGGSR